MSQNYPNNNQPVIVTAIPVADNSQPIRVDAAVYNVTVEPSSQAICRGCGRQFTRKPGTHDGQAQFYRCDECNGWTSIFAGSCTIH